MLKAVVFACGAALMGLELVAARVLAPALGNSIYVWGSVISTVMIALSLGYWLGGHVADRWGAPRTLAPVIAAASLATAAAPPLARWALPRAADLGPRLGSLVAATLIFFVPALLLAMVSPLGVRLAASRGMAHIGRSAGGLYSVSTAGSIVGTLATAFWLIPLLSLEPLMVWTGFALAATSMLALALAAREALTPGSAAEEHAPPRALRPRTVVLSTVAFAAAGVLLGTFVLVRVAPPPASNELGERVLFRADTQYHRITVTEDADARHLRFDRSHQSAMSLADPYESRIRYPDYLHLALTVEPDARRVLVLGLGGGSVTKRMWRDYPEVRVDSVEIDAVVVDVARKYFNLPEDDRLRVFNEDARRYVQRTSETYDVVIIDAYYADSLPFHLTTEEFFAEVKAHLAPDGVVAYNVISSLEGPRSKLFRSMYRTAGGVWKNLWAFPIGFGSDGITTSNRNIIMLASDAEVSRGMLLDRIERKIDGRVTIPGFERFGEDLYTGTVRLADVPRLTDQHAPTDSLISVN